ncbi:unnamed protein product [Haemonchus placei]|uniref:Uncharacterized protein n=1 Tax=Haemonchus placei TaxID=6290 RepID=A0A0N4XA55_HAEPC|nr:unnamed protein product [Haemonchus placei]
MLNTVDIMKTVAFVLLAILALASAAPQRTVIQKTVITSPGQGAFGPGFGTGFNRGGFGTGPGFGGQPFGRGFGVQQPTVVKKTVIINRG